MNKPKSEALPSFRSDLSRRLRVLEQQFKNRAEAAKAAGVAKGTYQTWVDGRSVPSIEAMAHLAKATNTPLDWIAFGEGQGPDGQPAVVNRTALRIDRTLIGIISNSYNELHKQRGYGDLEIGMEDLFYYYDELVTVEDQKVREIMLQSFMKERSRYIDRKEEEAAEIRAKFANERDSA